MGDGIVVEKLCILGVSGPGKVPLFSLRRTFLTVEHCGLGGKLEL